MAKRSSCIRRLAGGRSRQMRFSRFLHSDRVSAEEIAQTAATHTARAAQGRHVLAIQDTTDFNVAKHAKSKHGFGVIGNGDDPGFYVHPVIVVEAAAAGVRGVDHAGGILGLAGVSVYNREAKAPASRPLRDRTRKIKQRESGRWLEGLEAVSRTLAGAASVTLIGDRESDIYDLFAAPRPDNVHLIVRVQHDRALSEGGRLLERMANCAHLEGPVIDIPAKAGRAARASRVRVAFGSVTVERPSRVYAAKTLPASLRLFAVRVEEIDPPPGEKPVLWLLLTTHRVESHAEALQVAEWYRARWTVEQLFRTMKTQGFDLEESQVESFKAMRKLAVAILIASLRTLQLVHARNGDTGQKLTDAVEACDEPLVEALVHKLEGKTERLKCPHPAGSLGRLSWVVARLGGWNGYVGKHHRPAGPKTMALGLIQFDAIRAGWSLRKDV